MAESVKSSISEILNDWGNLYEANALRKAHFRAFWKDEVPLIFSPRQQSLYTAGIYDENATRTILLEVLEYFVFGKRLTEVLDEVRRAENPPTLCGRVFKHGEPTYSCRDCGLDPTCVLCVDCFKASAHRGHRYKMSTSSGGGYCDCGDKEAWKSAPFCMTHEKGLSPEQEAVSPLDRLPEHLVAKCRIVFEAVLDYCYQMLLWDRPMFPPEDLKEKDCADTFATMLFNDEVHTYEQVIRTLQRAIDCTHKEAIDYATVVDREGRSIVKCGDFNNCNQVKDTVERMTSHHNPKPLRVSVMRTIVVAHQNFALRLMQWMQQMINSCRAFRLLFSEAVSRPRPNDHSILEGIMEYDTHLWKTARSQWHQLLISGMLMEQTSKKSFSKLFARNYPSLMQAYIADDHDHSLSITSLSVQIFTVPTLAHMLIAEDDVLAILMRTFNSECETKLNAEGKLFFERNQTVSSFRRAQLILFDLKYLLSYKPLAWNTPLRRNFLHGLGKLFDLLSIMQGMDITIRHVGTHMEFEPEWESAFNLYIRMITPIHQVLEWCGTDRVVLIKAYRAALRKQATLYGHPVNIVHEVADHAVACVSYDVSSQQVSIHLPLSRLIAGLHLHLEHFDLSFDSPEFMIPDKPTPVFLMELPLRIQVMIAQVHAGMWRRNGYSLVNQIYFYQNVRCRAEMYDRDIVLLQMGASLIEGNEFLIHLLNKFGLMNWVRSDYETDFPKNEDDSVRQIIILVEEFLELLIVIVAERFTPGVGQVTFEDKVRKEIIQQLCIEPMAHSQLSKALPEDANHETGLESVINQVATFRKPQGTTRGLYELKQEFYKEYNPYFYHYGREDQSKAEEAQRKRKKQVDEEDCAPPPTPPPLSRSFAMMVNFLQSDVMMHIATLILNRFNSLRARTSSEMQLQKLLHLIGYGLLEEQRLLQSDTQDFFQFSHRAEKANVFQLLSALVGHQRIESNQELLNWVLRKYVAVQQLRAASTRATDNVPNDAVPMELANPARETASPSAGPLNEEKQRRAELAAARRARILAQMSDMQKNFIRGHADLFENTQVESGLSGSAMDLTEEVLDEIPVCLGPNQTSWKPIPIRHTCILCQEDQDVTFNGRAMVYSALVQKSTVLSKNRVRVLEKPDEWDPLFTSVDLFCAPHTSTCGHVMHADCWQKYLESVLAKERRRAIRIRHPLSFDLDKQEFLCPLCECLSNTVIPIVPALKTMLPDVAEEKVNVSMDDWLAIIQVALENAQLVEDPVIPITDGTGQTELAETNPPKQWVNPPTPQQMYHHLDDNLIFKLNHLYPDLFSPERESDSRSQFSTSIIEMLNLFGQATYAIGLGVELNPEDARVPLMVWYSCTYTIHSIENLLRSLGKPLFGELSSRQSDCLNVLVRFASVCAQVCRPSIVHTHSHRLLTALLHLDQLKLGILDVDAFGLLVTLVLSLPYLIDQRTDVAFCSIPQGLSQELAALQLIYALHVLQILLTTDFSKVELVSMEEDIGNEKSCLLEVYVKVTELLRAFSSPNTSSTSLVSPHLLQREVQQRSVPFLRCCALFFHCLTGVPAPQTLCEIPTNEYEFLCQYLGLTTDLSNLFESPRMKALVNTWLLDSRLGEVALRGNLQFPLEVNQLWKLPDDYSELINDASMFTCPNFDGEDSRTPTMCLVCGKMLCSQSYCCQTELGDTLVGACTNHVHFCGAGVGIFLRVRECKILLLAGKTKGCFVPPPYLDQYGETDQGLRRGNPLHLCKDNYRKLHKLWLSHGIPEEIAHSLESNAHIISVDWQHL